ncbi:MAG: TIGR04552 family protein [Bdellovibrionaceae bacterium]|nr:TIGR04552 family protein [Pseudobdellovibrionaceae bacterium]|tara:strand:- start:7651 stop:8742 length:1092 start_codon:yes stop_codon:yes gene_type:complete
MERSLRFNKYIFKSILKGRSIIDVPRLNISSLEDAKRFFETYGYDMEDGRDNANAWQIYRFALEIHKEFVLEEGEETPEVFQNEEKLGKLGHLLIMASAADKNLLQKWACSILRIMHVAAHLENDPFHNFSEEVQEQILKPFRKQLHMDPIHGIKLGFESSTDQIHLRRFDVKAYKGMESASLKLLAKKSEMALNLMDRIGVRFVTANVFDSFRVLRFLMKEYVVSVPNLVPDQTKNTLYPFNLFLEVMDMAQKAKSILPDDEIEALLHKRLEENAQRAEYKNRENQFSGAEYRVIKFIARRRIKLAMGDSVFQFFYPFEVQIMDNDTYVSLQSGPSEHKLYKDRQAKAARERILGVEVEPEF